MKEFCIVLSKVIRKEVCITAASENEAMERVQLLYESGDVVFDSSDTEHVNVHPKY